MAQLRVKAVDNERPNLVGLAALEVVHWDGDSLEVLNQRTNALLVDLEPAFHCLRSVVLPLDQVLTRQVVFALGEVFIVSE